MGNSYGTLGAVLKEPTKETWSKRAYPLDEPG